MMTSENNANRMLTKAAAFPFHAGYGTRGASILLLCAGLVACSHRAKSVDAGVVAPGASVRADRTDVETHASPLTDMVQARGYAPAVHAVRAAKTEQQRASSDEDTFAAVTGAVVSMPSPSIPRAHGEAPPRLPHHAAAPAQGSNWPWPWLLAMSFIATAGGLGIDPVRRGLWCAVRGKRRASLLADQPSSDDNELGAGSCAGLDDEEASMAAAGAETSLSDASLPSLAFSYQWPDDETRKHWVAFCSVDLLAPGAPGQAIDIDENTPAVASLNEGDETAVAHDIAERASCPLFDQLERIAAQASEAGPLLLIERGSVLPDVIRMSHQALPPLLLEAWERSLRQALPEAQGMTLAWLLVSTLLLRAEIADDREADALHAEAGEWIELGASADHANGPRWHARRIELDLHRARRQKAAARLLFLRGMQARHAQQLALGEPPVLFAWVDVLAFWAQCQFGDAALARYAEAEAICLRLVDVPAVTDAAQRRRADILCRRATIQQGGVRLRSLDTAQQLLDALYARSPSADNALAVARAALARGNVLPPDQAKAAYTHALMHAFLAEGEPRLRAESLQCRLAVQCAYESLPGMSAQSDVATGLATRLEALRVQHPETLLRMAQIHLRNADFARVCELCEDAWRNGLATPTLLAAWQEACRRWAEVSALPEHARARERSMRRLSIASAMR